MSNISRYFEPQEAEQEGSGSEEFSSDGEGNSEDEAFINDGEPDYESGAEPGPEPPFVSIPLTPPGAQEPEIVNTIRKRIRAPPPPLVLTSSPILDDDEESEEEAPPTQRQRTMVEPDQQEILFGDDDEATSESEAEEEGTSSSSSSDSLNNAQKTWLDAMKDAFPASIRSGFHWQRVASSLHLFVKSSPVCSQLSERAFFRRTVLLNQEGITHVFLRYVFGRINEADDSELLVTPRADFFLSSRSPLGYSSAFEKLTSASRAPVASFCVWYGFTYSFYHCLIRTRALQQLNISLRGDYLRSFWKTYARFIGGFQIMCAQHSPFHLDFDGVTLGSLTEAVAVLGDFGKRFKKERPVKVMVFSRMKDDGLLSAHVYVFGENLYFTAAEQLKIFEFYRNHEICGIDFQEADPAIYSPTHSLRPPTSLKQTSAPIKYKDIVNPNFYHSPNLELGDMADFIHSRKMNCDACAFTDRNDCPTCSFHVGKDLAELFCPRTPSATALKSRGEFDTNVARTFDCPQLADFSLNPKESPFNAVRNGVIMTHIQAQNEIEEEYRIFLGRLPRRNLSYTTFKGWYDLFVKDKAQPLVQQNFYRDNKDLYGWTGSSFVRIQLPPKQAGAIHEFESPDWEEIKAAIHATDFGISAFKITTQSRKKTFSLQLNFGDMLNGVSRFITLSPEWLPMNPFGGIPIQANNEFIPFHNFDAATNCNELAEAFFTILHHAYHYIFSGETGENLTKIFIFFWKFLFYRLARPGDRPPPVVVTASGRQGFGKTMLFNEFVTYLFGESHISLKSGSQEKTAHDLAYFFHQKLFCITEEGEGLKDMETIKFLATALNICINPKYKDMKTVKHYVSMIMMANKTMSIPGGVESFEARRLLCISSSTTIPKPTEVELTPYVEACHNRRLANYLTQLAGRGFEEYDNTTFQEAFQRVSTTWSEEEKTLIWQTIEEIKGVAEVCKTPHSSQFKGLIAYLHNVPRGETTKKVIKDNLRGPLGFISAALEQGVNASAGLISAGDLLAGKPWLWSPARVAGTWLRLITLSTFLSLLQMFYQAAYGNSKLGNVGMEHWENCLPDEASPDRIQGYPLLSKFEDIEFYVKDKPKAGGYVRFQNRNGVVETAVILPCYDDCIENFSRKACTIVPVSIGTRITAISETAPAVPYSRTLLAMIKGTVMNWDETMRGEPQNENKAISEYPQIAMRAAVAIFNVFKKSESRTVEQHFYPRFYEDHRKFLLNEGEWHEDRRNKMLYLSNRDPETLNPHLIRSDSIRGPFEPDDSTQDPYF